MNYGRNPVLRRALEAFFRHRALFIVSVLLVTGIVSASLLLRSRTYVTTASTYVTPENEVSTVLGFTKTSYISPAQQNVNHFNDLLKDDRPGGFLDNALRDALLRHPINVDPKARDKRFEQLEKSIFARADSGDVFTIGLIWDDPRECERIVTALQQRYFDEAGLTRQASSIATAKFLDSQISDYLKRMRVAENALIAYKKDHSGLLPEAQTAEIEQFASLKASRDTLRITARDADLKRQAIEARLTQIPQTTVLKQTVANDPTLVGKYGLSMQALMKRRADLLSRYLPDSDPVKEMDRQIALLQPKVVAEERERRLRNENNVVERTTQDNPEYVGLLQQLTETKITQQTNASRLQNLERQIAEYDARIKNLPVAARELSDRTRDYNVLKQQYEELLQRREQAKIKASLDRVAATATLSRIGNIYAKSTAGGKKILLLSIAALVLGLAVGVGMIVLGEWIDPTLRYDGDTERFLGVPVLANLPQVGVSGAARAIASLPASGGSMRGITAD